MINNRSSDRAQHCLSFLASLNWQDAARTPLAGDASSRRYERLHKAGQSAILMDAPPGAEAAPCPPGASITEREALGYNACARLAGPRLEPFLAVGQALNKDRFSAPSLIGADEEAGFALLEDLGDDLFAKAIPAGAPEAELYAQAANVLADIHHKATRPAPSSTYELLSYDQTAMLAEVTLLTDWYAPLKTGHAISDAAMAEYLSIWRDLLTCLPAPSTLVLRDFHAENLLWLPERPQNARVGLIDYQDALLGHSAYDLVSLLEDARRDVCPTLAAQTRDHFIDLMGFDASDKQAFMRDYAILGAQRNAKILGIFARLAVRDKKPRYLDLLPRVEKHMRNNLAHPELIPIRIALEKILPGALS